MGRIKKIFMGIVCILSLCQFALVPCAAAEVTPNADTTYLLPLTNKRLHEIAVAYLGEGYQFFQPASRENDMNTSASSVLDELSMYPLLAIKGQQIQLLVLKKSGGSWTVHVCSDTALQRPEFTLIRFSMEESAGTDTMYHAYFDYLDISRREWTLTLTLSDIYPCWFSAVHTGNSDITLNYERGMTFQLDFPFLYRCSYEIEPDPSISFRVDAFSFATCPLDIRELLKPISIRSKTVNLYLYPDDTLKPVFRLTEGESLDIVQQRQHASWSLAYYQGNFFFVNNSEIDCSVEK